MSSKKSATNNFATMVAEFGKNWKTVNETAKKKNTTIQDILKDAN